MSNSAKNEISKLQGFLHQQLGNYQKMLEMELHLKEILAAEKYQQLAASSRKKAVLMDKIVELDNQLKPLLAEKTDKSDSTQQLRAKAKDLIAEIQKVETENLQALQNYKDTMISSMKQSQTAKKAARGYKRSKNIFQASVDTKS
jgi:hypothetical protein